MTATPPLPAPPISAEGFFPDLPGSRLFGVLEVETAALVFVAPERAPVRLPLDGLSIRVSGIHHEHLLLEHAALPGVAVSAPTAALVDQPLLLAHAATAAQLGAARRQEKRGRLLFPGCLGLVVFTLVGLWLLKDPWIGWAADRVPRGVEESLGELLFTAVAAESPMVEDAALDRELEAFLAPLAAAARRDGVHLDFHLADDPSLNAFALPGGHIVIHSGLLAAAERPEEVLGVVAHEIAHVTERHSLRQLIGSAGLWVLFQNLFGDFSGLAGTVAEGGYRLLSLSFSRDQERAADAAGVATLVAARIDPRGLGDFFDRIEKETEQPGGRQVEAALAFLSTHPLTADRRERLAAQLAALPPEDFAPVAFDFAGLQERAIAAASETRAARR